MIISGLQKLTTLDYPGHIACTIFTLGCNLRCPFCHNSGLVIDKNIPAVKLPWEEFVQFLESRKGLLDGVVISGGEPLFWYDTPGYIEIIKGMGFKVKLDTNGSYPEGLKDAIHAGVDYIAMDIKNTKRKYPMAIGYNGCDISRFEKSIDIIKSSGVDYEFRSTLVKPLHTISDIKEIANWIGCQETKYALQNYVDSGDILNNQGFSSFSKEEIEEIKDSIKDKFKEVIIRGV